MGAWTRMYLQEAASALKLCRLVGLEGLLVISWRPVIQLMTSWNCSQSKIHLENLTAGLFSVSLNIILEGGDSCWQYLVVMRTKPTIFSAFPRVPLKGTRDPPFQILSFQILSFHCVPNVFVKHVRCPIWRFRLLIPQTGRALAKHFFPLKLMHQVND